MSGKNLRLLGKEQSNLWQPTIMEIMAELQAELAKGEAVYTKAELDQLTQKLADYELMLQRMTAP